MITAVLLLGMAGWALELAHPVFFDCEPVVLWSRESSPTPELRFLKKPWPAQWRMRKEGERTRWEANLCGAPLGIWTVSLGEKELAFLRVSEKKGVLEVGGAPLGALVVLDDAETCVVGENGTAFFVGTPGHHFVKVIYAGGHYLQKVELGQGQREVLKLAELEATLSSSEVLPGHAFSIFLRVRSELPSPHIQIELPPGWELQEDAEILPLLPGVVSKHRIGVKVPPETGEGEYAVSLRWQSLKCPIPVEVVRFLSPSVVVGHWDTQTNTLDLTTPFSFTFDRVLWASSLLGKPIPYTKERMTPELLRVILEAWATGAEG